MGLRGRARRGAAPGLPRLEPAAAEYFQQALAALQAGLGPDGDHGAGRAAGQGCGRGAGVCPGLTFPFPSFQISS